MSMATEAVREVVTLRIPAELREKIDARRKGRFTSVSEYIRDLIRRDVEESDRPAQQLVAVSHPDAA